MGQCNFAFTVWRCKEQSQRGRPRISIAYFGRIRWERQPHNVRTQKSSPLRINLPVLRGGEGGASAAFHCRASSRCAHTEPPAPRSTFFLALALRPLEASNFPCRICSTLLAILGISEMWERLAFSARAELSEERRLRLLGERPPSFSACRGMEMLARRIQDLYQQRPAGLS